jgi:N-methylhydantoinase A/oxoprolinase/acetone carboxylase beta subunit
LIIGLGERTNASGRILKSTDPDEVRQAAKILRKCGAQAFAVSLLRSL